MFATKPVHGANPDNSLHSQKLSASVQIGSEIMAICNLGNSILNDMHAQYALENSQKAIA